VPAWGSYLSVACGFARSRNPFRSSHPISGVHDYCAIETPNAASNMVHQWGDQGLMVGPFVFYGDAELLSRINVALHRLAPADAP
jgi:hypothetical protein